jgi:hypothetical protein
MAGPRRDFLTLPVPTRAGTAQEARPLLGTPLPGSVHREVLLFHEALLQHPLVTQKLRPVGTGASLRPMQGPTPCAQGHGLRCPAPFWDFTAPADTECLTEVADGDLTRTWPGN